MPWPTSWLPPASLAACPHAHLPTLPCASTQEFRSEVSLMARLRHPHVVLFMGAVSAGNQLAIVTQFIPRGSLFRLLHRSRLALDPRRRLAMALDVARGAAAISHWTLLPFALDTGDVPALHCPALYKTYKTHTTLTPTLLNEQCPVLCRHELLAHEHTCNRASRPQVTQLAC